MPFDQTPKTSTYQTKVVKLISELSSRQYNVPKDAEAINCFYEIVNNKQTGDHDYNVVSRAGTLPYGFVPPSPNIRGLYYWESRDLLYIAYSIYVAVVEGSTGVLVTTLLTSFSPGTSDVGFTEFSKATGDSVLVVSDGIQLMTINTANAMTQCTDVNLPTPHNPHVVFLDGYLFLVKEGTADIYNSNLDDPLLYTAGDFITAEMLPDRMIRISRLANYLVAFGTDSIEYFWDVANPTGSPLQRNETPIKLVGFLQGLAAWKNRLYFIGNTSTTGPSLYMLEDLKIENLGIPPISRSIVQATGYFGATFSMSGHDFYALSTGPYTYIMDLETKLWTRLALKQRTSFQITFSVSIPFTGYGYTSVVVINNETTFVMFRNDVFLDLNEEFYPTIITENEMFDSYRQKFGGRLSVIADRPPTSGILEVSWTDDDYQTYSTPRNVELNSAYPSLTALGSFRRRAFKLVHRGNCLMRLKSIELDINIGSR